MKKIFPLIISIILIMSCEILTPQKYSSRNVYLVSLALNYSYDNYQYWYPISSLACTLNDQDAMVNEMSYIANACSYPYNEIKITQSDTTYTVTENGKIIKSESYIYDTSIKEDVLFYISLFSSKMDENDLLIFHYSGHGFTGTGELVLNKKAKSSNITKENLIMINADDLYQSMKGSKGIKLFLIDSCYSGNFNSAITPDNPASPFKDFFSLPEKNENIFVLSGASSNEMSWESGGYGNMTRCFLEKMGYNTFTGKVGISGDSKYYSEVVSYVQKNVKNYMNGSKQHPEGASVKDFLIYSR